MHNLRIHSSANCVDGGEGSACHGESFPGRFSFYVRMVMDE